MQLAFFGGIYSNYLALDAAIRDAREHGAEALYCLGDMGAFGPHPDRAIELLREHGVICIQGNYDHSVGHALDDCRCGYTDPRDNHFAQLSYDYTLGNTSAENRAWLRELPATLRLECDGIRLLLCHGSPRRTNEFLWESTTSTQFLDRLLLEHEADIVLGTHTGLHWQRALTNGKHFVNVGVLGRPENDGRTNVWYTVVRTGNDARNSLPDSSNPRDTFVSVDFVPIVYDHERLARDMRVENLPEEFIATILSGWWTTCLEVLPQRERRRGRF